MALQKHVTTSTYVVFCVCVQKGNVMLCCWVRYGTWCNHTTVYTFTIKISRFKKIRQTSSSLAEISVRTTFIVPSFQSGNKSREWKKNTLIILHMLLNDIEVGIFCLFLTVNMMLFSMVLSVVQFISWCHSAAGKWCSINQIKRSVFWIQMKHTGIGTTYLHSILFHNGRILHSSGINPWSTTSFIILKDVGPCGTDQIPILFPLRSNGKNVRPNHILNWWQSRRSTEQLKCLITFYEKDIE